MSNHQNTGSRNILVLGAGELGMAVMRALSAQAEGAKVSVLLRASAIETQDPSRLAQLSELQTRGIKTLAGDIAKDTVSELAALFAAFDTVISCVGFAAGPGTQTKLTQAAIESGVERHFPWQFGVDYDVIGPGSAQDSFDEQLHVRNLLRAQQRIEWVIVSTGMFTSFLFETSFGVVDLANNTVHTLGDWDTQLTITTPEDIGLLTAMIVFKQPRFVNRIVYVAGDTITYGQLADVVESALGREISRVPWSVPMLRAELAKRPDDQLSKYRLVFAEGRGVAWDKAGTFNAEEDIDVVTLERWVAGHLER
ncbi:aromatic alcohol reductase [Pseudomonas frederiksbergensis]|uniref:Aromatic alcohol reductase n=1 Tax=Pseudomonas frederiksbergensis TaxID=104087 RepID=A0A423KB81_9PSED|nr:aromatic alcohol reductase [Pseudomonas frederiksbergensis]RON49338.1 aromatic alcohol reductase [Pseudomonas frederiksbergensis]